MGFLQPEARGRAGGGEFHPTLRQLSLLNIQHVCMSFQTWFQNRRSKFRKESQSGHIQWMRDQLHGVPGSSGASRQVSTGNSTLPSENKIFAG